MEVNTTIIMMVPKKLNPAAKIACCFGFPTKFIN